MSVSPFSGSFVALITPFKDDAIDLIALRDLVSWHLAEGTNGLAPTGTTGETPTLTETERRQVVETVIDAAGGRAPIMAGVGATSTAATIEKAHHAKAEGAHAGLVVTPYYNRPDQEGLYAHYMAVADAVELPLFVYNVPKRTGVDISMETLGRLSTHPNIIGVKDASADMGRVARMRRACGADFSLLSGDDASAFAFTACGGDGVISVTGNVAPGPMARLMQLALSGARGEAMALNERLAPLHDALFASASPGPTKYALSLLGKCTADLRLPLTPPQEAARLAVQDAMPLAQAAPVTA